MSQDSFKVPAKKSAPAKTDGASSTSKTTAKGGGRNRPATSARKPTAQPTGEKLRKARVTSSSRMPAKSLPDVPDLGNMPRAERMQKVLGIEKKTAPQKKREDIPSTDRFSSMKNQIRKDKETSVTKSKVDVKSTGGQEKGDWSLFLIRIAFALILAILIAVFVLAVTRSSSDDAPVPTSPSLPAVEAAGAYTVKIEEGMGARQVSSLFSPLIDGDALLEHLEANGLTSSIQVGTYLVAPGQSVEEVAKMITDRRPSTLTIWPGYTIEDIDRMLANRGLAPSGAFIDACRSLQEEFSMPFIEGWLLAGSYRFSSAKDLASDMLGAMLSLLTGLSGQVMAADLSLDQVVTIASMVNCETQDETQMPVIAAVILNRLEAGMPLGIDATTRYELDDWRGDVPQSVYECDTPYNTRRRPGLPPSGIGCPGAQAVLAVLMRDDTGALYYLHDEDGKLYTSMTYEEHLDTYEQVH